MQDMFSSGMIGYVNCNSHKRSNLRLFSNPQKGAIPLAVINAHRSKIYGVDWSRTSPSELVTCSLDSSIKRFSTTSLPPPNASSINPAHEKPMTEPLDMIYTAQPVWRARYLPFGHGVLSLPQRGTGTLQMFAFGRGNEAADMNRGPLAEYERPSLVKEYVWRSRGGSDRAFGMSLYLIALCMAIYKYLTLLRWYGVAQMIESSKS